MIVIFTQVQGQIFTMGKEYADTETDIDLQHPDAKLLRKGTQQ